MIFLCFNNNSRYIGIKYIKKKINNRKYDQNISIDKFFLIIIS